MDSDTGFPTTSLMDLNYCYPPSEAAKGVKRLRAGEKEAKHTA